MVVREARTRRRQGQIETPVILIFAIVAGVLILLVVGWFVLRQQETVSTTRTLEHLRGVAGALETSAASPGSVRNVTLIGELRFECDETGLSLWYGDDEQYPVLGLMAFGEASVRGVATVRSTPLGGAYRIGNIVTVTNANPVPNVATAEESSTPGAGSVDFGVAGDAPYFGEALKDAGLATGNLESYRCGLVEVARRYRYVNTIQRERVALMRREYALRSSPCQYLYDEEPFATIDGALGNILAGSGTENDAITIADAEGRLRAMNEALVRASCATVS